MATSKLEGERAQAPRNGVFGEALRGSTAAVALVLVGCVAAGGAMSALLRYDLIGYGHMPRSALTALVLLVLANVVARALRRRRWFSTAQILFAYLAVLVMSGFPGQQLVTYQYTALVGPAHYATPENKWEELFFEHIPRWTVPSLDSEHPAVKWAFWGMPAYASIPWQPWVTPLAVWTLFHLLILLNYVCVAGLFRRQWADRQRMLFPLATIPVELARYRDREAAPGVFRTWVFWVAFLIPMTIHSVNALHEHYPTIARIDTSARLGDVFAGRPWDQLNWLGLQTYFDVIGVTYFLPAEIGFSLWFFWLLKYGMRVGRSAMGRDEQFHFYRHVGMGTYLLLALVTLWQAREGLREIWQRALGRAPTGGGEDPEAREPLPGAWALWGFGGTLAALMLFAHALGADLWPALLMYGAYLLAVLVLSRLVCEAGIYVVWSPLSGGNGFVQQVWGVPRLGAQNVTAMNLYAHFIGDTASNSLASIFQGFKLVTAGGLRPRHALWLMIGALALGLVASHPPALYAIYSRGIPALGWWMRGSGQGLPGGIAHTLQNPEERFLLGHYGNMFAGAGMVLLLTVLHSRYLWWPLHPLGWAATFSSIVSERYGFSFLLGWALSRLVVKIGGYRAHRSFAPFTMGLVLGHGITLLTWTVIHYFHPITGWLVIE